MKLTEELLAKIREAIDHLRPTPFLPWTDAWLFGAPEVYLPTHSSSGWTISIASAPPEYNKFRIKNLSITLDPCRLMTQAAGARILVDEHGWACLYIARKDATDFVYVLLSPCGDVIAFEMFRDAYMARDAFVAQANRPSPHDRPAGMIPEDYYAL